MSTMQYTLPGLTGGSESIVEIAFTFILFLLFAQPAVTLETHSALS